MMRYNEHDLDSRERALRASLAELGSVLVAYSGGTDSTYLLAVSLDELGSDRVLAVTADSPLTARAEVALARTQAEALGARLLVVRYDSLSDPAVVANGPDRCYHCKRDLFHSLLDIGRQQGLAHVTSGENADDQHDYRPGRRACAELGIRAPLAEIGLTKSEVRVLSRQRGLPTWDRPAAPCLATRFPYDTALTAEGLARVEAAEARLQGEWGAIPLRVRDHFPLARIEIPPDEIARLARPKARALAVRLLRELGYVYVTLDLAGYRMGSLNEVLAHTESH
ncbi:MAG TPA: ATP-dependent sacrificial sulfur transferase LarE [Anaerolineae bacterium]|nr:ATP-dependent sacrificial sulfur transferase LarE [Anaerolineae bacterium]